MKNGVSFLLFSKESAFVESIFLCQNQTKSSNSGSYHVFALRDFVVRFSKCCLEGVLKSQYFVTFVLTVGVVFDIHSCCVQLVSSKGDTVLLLISFRVGLSVHDCLPASFCEEQNPAVPFQPDTSSPTLSRGKRLHLITTGRRLPLMVRRMTN